MKRQMSKETYEKLLLSNIRYQKTDKGKEAVKKAVLKYYIKNKINILKKGHEYYLKNRVYYLAREKQYRINKQNEANNNGIRSNECKNKRNIL